MPGAGGARPRTAPGGDSPKGPITRGPTSLSRLELEWDYPVVPTSPNGTTLEGAGSAMPLGVALRALAGDDRRPLLCVRECNICAGTDAALLAEESDNEKTKLLSRWFHCVKLPPDVSEPRHPFYALFAGEQPDKTHLFISRWDGSGRIDMDGKRSEAKLWQAMRGLLESEYEGDATRSLNDLFVLLDQYDAVDARIQVLEERMASLLERVPSDSPKVREAAVAIEKARAERDQLRKRDELLTDLRLRSAAQPAVEGDAAKD